MGSSAPARPAVAQPVAAASIRRVLVANRGEIAVRVVRACRSLGIETVVVVSTVDRDGMAARLADRAVCIGPAPAGASYLAVPSVLSAALGTGCDAVHPGYGFLSENPAFAAACVAEGLVFVGPRPEAVAQAGDKARARELARSAGIPTLSGSPVLDTADQAARAAAELGYPVLVKAAAGGGGRGMSVVEDEAGLRSRWPAAGGRGPGRVRRRAALRRTVHPQRPPHRGAGARGQARQRDPHRRTRLHAAAPPPEGRRGVPGAEHPGGRPPGHPAERRRLRRGLGAGQRGDRRVHLRRRHVHLRLPGVQRADPGGASGERDGLGPGPRSGAAPVRGRGAPAVPAGRRRPRRPRGRGPDHHRGPGPRLHAASGAR